VWLCMMLNMRACRQRCMVVIKSSRKERRAAQSNDTKHPKVVPGCIDELQCMQGVLVYRSVVRQEAEAFGSAAVIHSSGSSGLGGVCTTTSPQHPDQPTSKPVLLVSHRECTCIKARLL